MSDNLNDHLEPEQGGLYTVFIEHLNEGEDVSTYHSLNFKQEGLNYLNIATGHIIYMPFLEPTSSAYQYGTDMRVMSLKTAQDLGLEVHDLAAIKDQAIAACEKSSVYFNEVLNNGILFSLSELKDREFVAALDDVNNALYTQILHFDDAQYEPIFQSIERNFDYFSIKIAPSDIYEGAKDDPYKDYHSSAQDKSDSLLVQSDVFDQFNKNKQDRDFDYLANIPNPVLYDSETDYIKAHTNILAKSVLSTAEFLSPHGTHINLSGQSVLNSPDTNPLILSKQEYKLLHPDNRALRLSRKNFVSNIAGTMIAAKFKVKTTKDDLRKLQYFCQNNKIIDQANKDKEFISQMFNVAGKIATQVIGKQNEINNNNVVLPLNSDVWSHWKNARANYAKQLASPSLAYIVHNMDHSFTKEDVSNAISRSLVNKSKELAPYKEQIKEVLKTKNSINKAAVLDFKNTNSFIPNRSFKFHERERER